ncbi:ribokinase, partial [Acinetobacter baumannii]
PAPFNDKVKAIDLSLIDYLVVNEIEGCDLANEEDEPKVIDTLKSMYPQTHILLTLGSKGCLYTQGEMVIKQEAYKVEAVDTTAAGDTFIGYFIAGLVEGYEIKECLELAARASAITVTRKGSSSSIPTIEEVRQL